MRAFALPIVCLVLVACSRGAAPSGLSSQATEVIRKPAMAAPSAPAPSLDPKVLLSDDKLGRYVVYQREMNSVAGLTVGAATQAFGKSGGEQKGFEKALSADERTRRIAEAQAAALAKSGLSQAEAIELMKLVTPFTAQVSVGDAETKAKARQDFSAKHGPAALAAVEKHLPDLVKVQDEMLHAVFKKK